MASSAPVSETAAITIIGIDIGKNSFYIVGMMLTEATG